MEISGIPLNPYPKGPRQGGAPRISENNEVSQKIGDTFEPSASPPGVPGGREAEVALVLEQIRVLPEVRSSILVQAKDNMLMGKYNDPEILEPLALKLMG